MFDPLKEVKTFEDTRKFPLFEDEWLRGGSSPSWVPQGFGSQTDLCLRDGWERLEFRNRELWSKITGSDYENFSHTLPDKYFPKGANWLMLGHQVHDRLRLAVEHLAQYRGGNLLLHRLGSTLVIKLIKKGWMEHLEEYKKHCIEQAIHDFDCWPRCEVQVRDPKCSTLSASHLKIAGTSLKEMGITGIFSGGTDLLRSGLATASKSFSGGPAERERSLYMTPTYGNTLMGLACSRPVTAAEGYKIAYYAPQSSGR